MDNLTCFILGVAVGALFAVYDGYVYKKTLVRVANSTHNEKIFGEWYRITPVNREWRA